ncbi:MAG: pyridoxamine 5'-phosphate oxidase, partial [Bacteroidales bacterium]|nr:pyridoxamine 5'-phosphate oxidase [Bacteroidales bacterium]
TLAADGSTERPPYWGGYILNPLYYEFWQGATGRTHDRFNYTKDGDNWKITRLFP